MNNEQINAGVKEIVMALFAMAATAYEANYVLKQLEKRPEPITQKIEALKIADSKLEDNSEFDNTVKKVLTYYAKKPEPVKVTLPDKPIVSKKIESPKPQQKKHSGLNYNLLSLVKKHESFSPTPYWDYKQYSIGYGTKALPTDKRISRHEAEKRLHSILATHRKAVEQASKKWGYNWSPNQIDALTSFRYNVGSIGKLTANGTRDNRTIAKKILEYSKAGGKTLGGLVKRRKDEQLMFLSGSK